MEPGAERLKFAMVCYSNQNRSMEAHKLLAEAGLHVVSFGVGSTVRLPGPTAREPNVYEFGTPYKTILTDLRGKPARDQVHYERLGLISMLERNLKIKLAPERWQTADIADLDVVMTFEEKVMDTLLTDMMTRASASLRPVLVVNLEVPDNNREAMAAGPEALHLAKVLEKELEWFGRINEILDDFADRFGRKTMYSVVFV